MIKMIKRFWAKTVDYIAPDLTSPQFFTVMFIVIMVVLPILGAFYGRP